MLATRQEPGRLRPTELARPTLDEGEVLVHVDAASVSRLDLESLNNWLGRSKASVVPGCDTAGVVVGTRGDVDGFKAGDRVVTVARPGAIGSGTYAELVSVPAPQVTRVPDDLDLTVAAALPLVGLAAYQALYAIMPEPGETVLIQGASGGVGTLAIQLARRDGARVIAGASAASAPLCRALGAELVVDSRRDDAVQAVRRRVSGGCNALLNLVDHETQPDSAAFLARRSRVVTLVSLLNRDVYADRLVTAWRVDMRPDRKTLEELLGLVARGALRPVIADILPLARAEVAHAWLRAGGVQGKLVLRVSGGG